MKRGSEQYRVVPFDRWSFGRNLVALRSRAVAATVLIPGDLAARLQRCRSFKPLHVHAAERFAEGLRQVGHGPFKGAWLGFRDAVLALLFGRQFVNGEGSIAAIEDALEEAARSSLLVARSAVVELLGRTSERPVPEATITTVAFPTANRPRGLARSLAGFVENAASHGRRAQWLVVDDSTDADAVAATRAETARVAEKYGASIDYLGRHDKVRWAKTLAREAGVPYEVAAFGLVGPEGQRPSRASNRNAIILSTIGELVLTAADDALCRPMLRAGTRTRPGCRLDSRPDPRDHVLFLSHEEAVASADTVREDVVGLHESLLGRTLQDCVSLHGGAAAVDLSTIDERALEDILLVRGRIRGTQNGLVGRADAEWPTEPPEIDHVRWSRRPGSEFVRGATDAPRAITACVDLLTLSNGEFVSTAIYGLDNRAVVPPFAPGLGQEAVLFGRVFAKCFDDVYFGHLPCMVVGDPTESGDESRDFQGPRADLETPDLVGDLIRSVDLRFCGSMPSARMRVLGRGLLQLARLPSSELGEVLRMHVMARSAATMARLEHGLRSQRARDRPRAEDLRNRLAALRIAVQDEAGSSLTEGRRGSTRAVKGFLDGFGQLLCAWPDLIEAARRHRASFDRA